MLAQEIEKGLEKEKIRSEEAAGSGGAGGEEQAGTAKSGEGGDVKMEEVR